MVEKEKIMKVHDLELVKKLQQPNFWLCAIAIALTIIQLNLTWKLIGNFDTLTIRALLWSAILYIIWKKRHKFNLESDTFSTLCGIFLINFILFKSISLFWFESLFIKVSALLSFLGLALIASGFKGLKQYIKEFFILLLILTDGSLLSWIHVQFDPSLLAAKVSHFMLWYLGFDVYRQGVKVILPTGAIEIYEGCSGLNAMILLLQLSLLFIITFSSNVFQKIIVPIVAVLTAFIINVFRLVLMAILVAQSNHEAFKYWHNEGGNQIFSTISIFIFGIFCYCILQSNQLGETRKIN